MTVKKRIFIGLIISDQDKKEIFNTGSFHLSNIENVKQSPQENLHLTLAFLGSLEAQQITDLEAMLTNINMDDYLPLEVNITQLSPFPKSDSKLLAAIVENNEELDSLWKTLWKALKKMGFKPDHIQFRPHITLARKYTSGKSLEFKKSLTIKEVAIFESRSTTAGVCYAPLSRFSVAS